MISLIKLEGTFDESTCYITINGQLSEILTELNCRPSIRIKSHGQLRIIVKDKNEEIGRSVGIHTSLLPENVPQWLPLLKENDFLKKIPETTQSPRVLILYQSDKLETVMEVNELNTSNEILNSNFDQLFANMSEKNFLLKKRVFDLENEIHEKK